MHSAATLGLSAQLARFWWGFLGVVPALAAVLTGTAVALTQRPRRERGFLGWWMLGTIGGGMIGALWWAHYFIQWMPPLVLGTALGLRDLGRLRPALRRTVAGIGLAGVMLFLSDVPQWTRPERIEVRREKGGASAAAFVAARSDPGDSIYVAGWGTEVYYMAGRYPAVPENLFRMQLWVPSVRDTVHARLRRRTAAYVLTREPADIPAFADSLAAALAGGYTHEASIGNFLIWRRSPGTAPVPRAPERQNRPSGYGASSAGGGTPGGPGTVAFPEVNR